MANLANAKKAIRVQKRKADVNAVLKAKAKKAVKLTLKAVQQKDAEGAKTNYQAATKALDKATKRYLHKNTASRIKSRLAKKVNSI